MGDLEKENRRLQSLVKGLLDRIGDNQKIDEHYKTFELQLLGCRRLADLLDLLVVQSVDHFQLADSGLILIDRDYSLSDLLRKLNIGLYRNRLQLRNTDAFATSIYPGRFEVSLGELDPLTAGRLFPHLKSVGSAALMPLMRRDELIGSLHFASPTSDRFSADKAVDFMHRLASICALCLENSITHENLHFQSRFDSLTQVSNRMHFDTEFGVELERAQRSREPLTCAFVDLDHFKQINDAHGHATGDVCLKLVAKTIEEQLRKTDMLARYGGEEFVALLTRCDQAQGITIAERVRQQVESVGKLNNLGFNPTVSIGLACWQPVADQSVDLKKLGQRLLKCADEALYEAKHGGRNRVVVRAFYYLVEGG